MSLIENLKRYFKKRANIKDIVQAPEGVCPNCWGKQEWDGEYYKFMKGENGNPSDATYNNFIQEVARKLDKITLKENTYTCETCKMTYKHGHN